MRLIKVGLASVNTTVGALSTNVDRALAMAQEMAKAEVTVAVFPEQLVAGYPHEDLAHWHAFVDGQWTQLLRFAEATARLPLVSVLGVSIAHQGLRYNCAAVVAGGVIAGLVPKEKLPTYGVFYEGRTYSRGYPGFGQVHRGVPLGDQIFEFDFGCLAAEVCEDLWSADGPLRRRAYSGAELVCNISSSPFRVGIDSSRRELIATRAADHQCTVAYANQVGAQDGLIFDGGGFLNQNGRLVVEAPRFSEGWAAGVVDLDRTSRLRAENTTWREDARCWAVSATAVPLRRVALRTQRQGLSYPVPPSKSFFLPAPPAERGPRAQYCEDLLDALAMGVGDYFEKTKAFECIGISLSGGRDSLLTLLVAHRYASKSGVPIETFYLPSRYSSVETRLAAQTIAKELGVRFTELSIDEAFEREMAAAQGMLGDRPLTEITKQNIQARLRAQRMWNWANSSRGLFLQTGNMSEKAVGYTTIGGDLMGALAVIANLPKTVVMYLLEYVYRTSGYEGIALVTARPPGPELKPNQVGEEELMPFPILDACFHLFAGEKLGFDEVLMVTRAMFPDVPAATMEEHVRKFVRLFTQSIYKWVQSPISLHVGNLDLDRERALQLPVVIQTQW